MEKNDIIYVRLITLLGGYSTPKLCFCKCNDNQMLSFIIIIITIVVKMPLSAMNELVACVETKPNEFAIDVLVYL